MPNTRITISYKKYPLHIYGLPDTPVFKFRDIVAIVGRKADSKDYDLISELESFTTAVGQESISVVNTAGLYRMIFNASNPAEALEFEKFFIKDIEPALRKYGYPAENSSC